MNNKLNFTKTAISKLAPSTEGKRLYFYDHGVKGLALSITPKGIKSFLVYKFVKGKPVRITLGHFPEMTIEQARKKTIDTLSELAKGINPNTHKQHQRSGDKITLNEVFEKYLEVRNLKDYTRKDYTRCMNETFKDWLNQPINELTNTKLLQQRHQDHGQRSLARANNAFRVLRALFTFAHNYYRSPENNRSLFLDANGNPLLLENPVSMAISNNRAWHRVERKRSYIKFHEIKTWYNSVLALKEIQSPKRNLADTASDYLLFLFFTGCRPEETAKLEWEHVDLHDATFDLVDPKNRQSITLPMNTCLLNIMKNRYKTAQTPFVFPGTGSKGYLIDVRQQMKKVAELASIPFTLSDLRRTFITTAESLDISPYTYKKLINHKLNANFDVTVGYIVSDIKRLRKASQQIADFFMEQAGITEQKDINVVSTH